MLGYFYVKQYSIITFLMLFNLLPKECRNNPDRIIGGKPATIKGYPYIVALILKYDDHSIGMYFRGAGIIVSKHWALTAAHCLAQFTVECRNNPDRIIGGKPATIKGYPYIVALILKYDDHSIGMYFRGAGIIVSKHWALTAAHCLAQFTQDVIEAGFVFLRGNSSVWDVRTDVKRKDHKIIKYYMHPKFSKKSEFDCDIAIVKVKEPFTGRYEKPIKVAGKNFMHNMKKSARVVGWGTTDHGTQLPVERLRVVSITLFPHKNCVNAYRALGSVAVTDNMICGGSNAGGKDSCSGDSGGPLVQVNVLIGIVSYGLKCGLSEYPGVYTKVSAFQDWLVELEKEVNTTFNISYTDKAIKFERRRNRFNIQKKVSYHWYLT